MEYEEMIAVYESMDQNTMENFNMIIRDQSPKNLYELIDLWKQARDFIGAEEQRWLTSPRVLWAPFKKLTCNAKDNIMDDYVIVELDFDEIIVLE